MLHGTLEAVPQGLCDRLFKSIRHSSGDWRNRKREVVECRSLRCRCRECHRKHVQALLEKSRIKVVRAYSILDGFRSDRYSIADKVKLCILEACKHLRHDIRCLEPGEVVSDEHLKGAGLTGLDRKRFTGIDLREIAEMRTVLPSPTELVQFFSVRSQTSEYFPVHVRTSEDPVRARIETAPQTESDLSLFIAVHLSF